MKKYFMTVLLGGFCLMVSAQQDPMYSQYMFNTLAVNPAYAGSREVLSITALSRWQWSGIEGSPQTQTLSLDMPVMKKSFGVGLQLINDKLGVSKNTGFFVSYAYRLRLSNNALISIGLQGGVNFFRSDFLALELSDDPSFSGNINRTLPNAGVGFYYSQDKFYAGISVPHLIKNKLDDFIRQSESNRSIQYRHLFLMTGYVFSLSEEVKLKPSVLLKVVKGSPWQADVNTNVWLKDVLAVGLSYRTGNAMVGMLEWQASRNLRFGYAYDWTANRLRQYIGGSHEIMLRYEFGKEKDKIISPRYF
ncbi:MAG: type IX secretion system membrane protein PorP/SprF [Verrucomicrobia bacterium]|nr:type IX secretion system membrane protein PorP/SprF [Cytophagales bacterium]